jgi:hypothetical protein
MTQLKITEILPKFRKNDPVDFLRNLCRHKIVEEEAAPKSDAGLAPENKGVGT